MGHLGDFHFKEHLKKNRKLGVFTRCSICPKKLLSKFDLIAHLVQDHDLLEGVITEDLMNKMKKSD
jgi:hypothetical protein